ncbi:hypothetical protein, partial [Leptospira noguchii]|uniref:hypothetical protein n=1 Tax=Leptospira noguchii TaxID=28182 RepID=UPI001F23E82C
FSSLLEKLNLRSSIKTLTLFDLKSQKYFGLNQDILSFKKEILFKVNFALWKKLSNSFFFLG